jgi:acylphosphatase
MNEEMARVQLKIHGEVQGVFYRQAAKDAAQALNLTGRIRNTPDGTVEATVEGPRKVVESFVVWAADGPPAAHVRDVERSWEPASGEFDDFEIVPD